RRQILAVRAGHDPRGAEVVVLDRAGRGRRGIVVVVVIILAGRIRGGGGLGGGIIRGRVRRGLGLRRRPDQRRQHRSDQQPGHVSLPFLLRVRVSPAVAGPYWGATTTPQGCCPTGIDFSAVLVATSITVTSFELPLVV